MNMIDCKGMIVSLLERIDSVREEKLSAGTKYRLMGLVADIAELVQGLQEKVLTRVSQEVVLDADVDIDYAELSEEVLAIGEAMKFRERLQEAGFVDEKCQLTPNTTRKQAMYIADMFSERLQMRSKWKAFQDLWHINNLAQEKWEMQETGKVPVRSREIETIFI